MRLDRRRARRLAGDAGDLRQGRGARDRLEETLAGLLLSRRALLARRLRRLALVLALAALAAREADLLRLLLLPLLLLLLRLLLLLLLRLLGGRELRASLRLLDRLLHDNGRLLDAHG